jgi:hypothetical protein
MGTVAEVVSERPLMGMRNGFPLLWQLGFHPQKVVDRLGMEE